MAFGQQAGPPATARQVEELKSLVLAAGHTDFRDARGPLNLNQRQAAGRFTRDEAETLIAQLEADTAEKHETVSTKHPTKIVPSPSRSKAPAVGRVTPQTTNLGRVASGQLAAELQRRGWIVVEP